MTAPSWSISPMTAADLEAIHAIDCQSSSPWSRKQLEAELSGTGGQQLICRDSGEERPLGFLLARVILDEAEILKLATSRKFHRCGVASLLLNTFIDSARKLQVRKIYLELRAGNTAALALYCKHAFKMTGRRPNYYTDPNDDALCMTRSL